MGIIEAFKIATIESVIEFSLIIFIFAIIIIIGVYIGQKICPPD
jgi:hypothetical protein